MGRTHYVLRKMEEGGRRSDEPKQLTGSILIIDPNDRGDFGRIKEWFPSCQVIHKTKPKEAYECFQQNNFDLILLDHSPLCSCVELLPLLKTSRPSIPVCVMTDCGSEELAIEVFRNGARDYFKKPLKLKEIEWSIRAMLGIQSSGKNDPGNSPLNGLEAAVQYLDSHFNLPLTLSQVAEVSGMSVSSFSRHFKKKTGMTFVDYLNRLRVSNARRLLIEEQNSLIDVANSCGFDSQTYFNKIFKKFVGVTPRQYRKSMDSQPDRTS